jgi:hypothetical protein
MHLRAGFDAPHLDLVSGAVKVTPQQQRIRLVVFDEEDAKPPALFCEGSEIELW